MLPIRLNHAHFQVISPRLNRKILLSVSRIKLIEKQLESAACLSPEGNFRTKGTKLAMANFGFKSRYTVQ
jgi:hypothetical protein